MATFGVHSEVGKLRQVIVHRPELSLKRLTPDNHDELLFDDVLWVERAQWEHDQFVARMRERGVEVFYVQDLLAEALAASPEARQRLVDLVTTEYVVGPGLVDDVRAALADFPADKLARHLLGGLTVGETGAGSRKRQASFADRGGRRRPDHLRPPSASQLAVHARLVVLDLRRCLGQPHVLAGAASRGLQHGRHLPRPSDVRGRRLRVLVPAPRRGRAVPDRGLRPGHRWRAATSRSSATGRWRSACPSGPRAA